MIALIADVHGNLPALEAVLADMLRFDVDEVLSLGDLANLGPRPSASLKRIQALEPLTIMGNTDAYLLEPRTAADVTAPNDATQMFLDIERWSAERLDDVDREFVRSFAPNLSLERDGLQVVAYHGSPRSYDDPLRPLTPDETLDDWFAGYPARLYLGGHTHEQFVRRYRDAIVANPGSVGMSFVKAFSADDSRNLPVAEYALLQVIGGEPNLYLRRVPYDINAYRNAVMESGMPHADAWLSQFT
ncbi:MAG TPA: metallophosphoesterase family protein [Trueperaceae bacterium]|nr:metallophosphoesterase family protein [Trueperaceae bacterium]